MLLCCLICFGVEPEAASEPAPAQSMVVDDLDDDGGAQAPAAGPAAQPAAEPAEASSDSTPRLMKLLQHLFGKNANKVTAPAFPAPTYYLLHYLPTGALLALAAPGSPP